MIELCAYNSQIEIYCFERKRYLSNLINAVDSYVYMYYQYHSQPFPILVLPPWCLNRNWYIMIWHCLLIRKSWFLSISTDNWQQSIRAFTVYGYYTRQEECIGTIYTSSRSPSMFTIANMRTTISVFIIPLPVGRELLNSPSFRLGLGPVHVCWHSR